MVAPRQFCFDTLDGRGPRSARGPSGGHFPKWGSKMGSKNGVQKWGPQWRPTWGPKWSPTWGPKMGSKNGVHNGVQNGLQHRVQNGVQEPRVPGGGGLETRGSPAHLKGVGWRTAVLRPALLKNRRFSSPPPSGWTGRRPARGWAGGGGREAEAGGEGGRGAGPGPGAPGPAPNWSYE